jgi:acyl carrier protein
MSNNNLTKEFQLALEEELGININEKEARKVLDNLVGYFDLLKKIENRKVEAPHMSQ